MNILCGLIASLVLLVFGISCQPLADSRSNYINFYMEMLNPSFRQHRARLRPFGNQLGSPILNIRGARDVSKLENLVNGKNSTAIADCIYSFESLFCSGFNNNNEHISVECDARENFKSTDYAKMNQFSIGNLRILDQQESGTNRMPIVKLYLYPKVKNSSGKSEYLSYRLNDEKTKDVFVFSINYALDKLDDKGLSILNGECWIKMLRFFASVKNTESILVQKEDAQDLPWIKSISTIANLRFL